MARALSRTSQQGLQVHGDEVGADVLHSGPHRVRMVRFLGWDRGLLIQLVIPQAGVVHQDELMTEFFSKTEDVLDHRKTPTDLYLDRELLLELPRYRLLCGFTKLDGTTNQPSETPATVCAHGHE